MRVTLYDSAFIVLVQRPFIYDHYSHLLTRARRFPAETSYYIYGI